ncbi:DUF2283 domain-containing protein [Candidatus Parcubacteria bacterium]|nr:MAG: DUF2283 domain-containing protein [Candidatus Parcubacteria bacterium]
MDRRFSRCWESRAAVAAGHCRVRRFTHLALSDEPEVGSVEIRPNITAGLNDKGELIGIEILNASAFLRDSILESVQAKVLQLSGT